MSHLVWKKHPFRLLLYLEWILLGIALVVAFSRIIPSHHHSLPPSPLLNLGRLTSIAALGAIGWRLPFGDAACQRSDRLLQTIYIGIGFSLCWLTVILTGQTRAFPILLLIVVIRACILFSWSGRIAVAIVAYISFLSVEIISFSNIPLFGIFIDRPLPRILRRLPPEQLQRVLFGLTLNSALLFGLVLAFVLLSVGATLAEKQSSQNLALANRRLREYASKIENQATLQERNRIAREIHDSVGHYLTAQSIQLENAALFLDQDSFKVANYLEKARQLNRQALTNVRQSVGKLRQPLEAQSLSTLLERLIIEFKQTTNIAIQSKINLSSSISTEVNTIIYRVIQEALTNITKHSQASSVNLILEANEIIYLTVQDNGCGFDQNNNTTGFGLQGMQERVEAVNGSFSVQSQPQQGCKITVEISQSAG